jgi:phenylalanyl-tRNA synthetase beta subunit
MSITIDLPENQISFFKELIKNLNYQIIEEDDDVMMEIPQWEQDIVAEVDSTENEANYISLNELKAKMKVKYDF